MIHVLLLLQGVFFCCFTFCYLLQKGKKDMINNFVERTDFASYEDFKEKFRLTYPKDFNFATHVVDAWAEKEPDRKALIWCDDRGHDRTFTFQEISDLSKKAARFIYTVGIRKGDRVMVQLKRRWEYWVTAVALHRIGAVLIPVSYQMSAKDIAYRINAANIKMIISVDDPYILEQVEEAIVGCDSIHCKALVGAARSGWLDFNANMEACPPDYIKEPTLTGTDLMLFYFTSGTTGMPKMVVHDHLHPLGHITTAKYWQKVIDGGLHITVADSGWAKFGWGSIYGQWICGSALLGYDAANKFSARNLINVIRKYKPTTLCVPGTIYRFMMKEGIDREDFISVRHCCTAGEPLAPEITRTFFDITGLTIHEGFGQSESSVMIGNFTYFDPRPGSTGKPAPLYDLCIMGEDGEDCAPGDVGEVVVRNMNTNKPEGLLRGYWKEEGLVPAWGEDGIYHTGDLAWIDNDGYIWFVGRNDDMIKCSGYRIGPFEIESVLLTHPSVLECAITGSPDPIRGQIVKATIVLNTGFEASDELRKELQEYVKHMTAPYKYPRIVDFVEALPKTTSGKIMRRAI